MENKLYVTNLSADASAETLRARFSICGEVVEVELLQERQGPRAAPAAYVTMKTGTAAQQVVRRLSGTLHEGRALMISAVQNSGPPARRGGSKQGPDVRAAVVHQYRERLAMTYELDCTGESLILRMFFPLESEPSAFRVEARSRGGAEAVVMERTGPSRALALHEVSEAWQALPTETSAPCFDWPAVTRALKDVRAI